MIFHGFIVSGLWFMYHRLIILIYLSHPIQFSFIVSHLLPSDLISFYLLFVNVAYLDETHGFPTIFESLSLLLYFDVPNKWMSPHLSINYIMCILSIRLSLKLMIHFINRKLPQQYKVMDALRGFGNRSPHKDGPTLISFWRWKGYSTSSDFLRVQKNSKAPVETQVEKAPCTY